MLRDLNYILCDRERLMPSICHKLTQSKENGQSYIFLVAKGGPYSYNPSVLNAFS